MKTKSWIVILLSALVVLASCSPEEIKELKKVLLEDVTTQINDVEEQVEAIEVSVEKLQKTDTLLRKTIAELQQQESTLEETDKALAKGISDLRTELSGDISTAEANCLAQLEAYRQTVNTELTSLHATLDTLKKKDAALQSQIDDLKTYVDDGIKNAKDWASGTFATLEAYNATATVVASIQGQISSINEDIADLKAHAMGVTKEELDAAIGGLREELQPKIQKVADDAATALNTAVESITAAYGTAITTAISESESSLKSWVNTQLTAYYTASQVDAKLSTLKSNLEGQLNSQKTYLVGLINNLETTLTSKINANKTLIDGLQSQINTVSGDLSTLAGTVAANSSAISSNAKAISDNASAIAQNASDIDACERLIAANKKLIQNNETAIGTNATAIAALQARATTDEQQISGNATKIAKNASDIAQNARDIAANAALISANATAISNNAKAISDNAAEISQLKTDLAQAKTDITAAYTSAISTAINTLNGQLTGQIATEVSTLNARITSEVETIDATIAALTTRVSTCEKEIKSIKNTIYSMQQDIEDLQEQVAAILARIQSITYVPKYSDGKAIMTYTDNGVITAGTATFDFELQPASTAAELVKVWNTALSMTAVYTITKAPETVALSIESATAENGYLTIVVSGSALKEAYFKNQCSANVRLKVSDGNNEIATDYIRMVPWTTDVISFADANFKAYCVENFDTSGDGEITEEEAKAVTAIDCSLANLTSLVGIEYFSNLQTLDVSCNKLTTLDLSHSPKLTEVLVNNNQLQSLNLSGLAALKTLDCSSNKLGTLGVSESAGLETLCCNSNQIGSLNLSNNKSLKVLQCNNNHIGALNLKNNAGLETLNCRKNELSVLDVTGLAGLKALDCSDNTIASLNLYHNPVLESLYCASNGLTTLGVGSNTSLTFLDCSSNLLSTLDVSKNTALETLDASDNQLSMLDVSRNAALESVSCNGNAAMAKLWVKDAAQRDALTIRKEDATVISFNNGGIYIPDAKLKAYLLALFDDDEDGEISILEAENVQNVNCSGRGIADLTGLECCTNLKYLNFNGNNVSTVELPNLKKLETIVAYGNPISRLNINNDTTLTALYLQDVNTNALSGTTMSINAYDQASTLYLAFAGTQYITLNLTNSAVLTSYDIAENIQLTKLVASGNPNVTAVDLSTLTALTYLDLNACGLTALNVDNNINLDTLYCSNNKIATLNLDNNVELVLFNCSDNLLGTLRVTNNTHLQNVDVSNNNLVNINVRQNSALARLVVSGNEGITALALGYNKSLQILKASNTGLTDIDLSSNTALRSLTLKDCLALNILDLTANTALAELYLTGTSLSALSINGCPLEQFKISGTMDFLIGQYVVSSGVMGVIFYAASSKVKIVSADEATKAWGYSGTKVNATSASDGVSNTNKIPNSDAAKWCRAKGTAWYLPAQNELSIIYNNKSILNTTLFSVGGTQLGTGCYWSSTEENTINYHTTAFYINFNNGVADSNQKNNSYYVRAIREL